MADIVIADEIALLEADLAAAQPAIQNFDQYYEGEQALKYMAPAMAAEIGETVAQLVLNWPRIVADAYEGRLDVEGFRYTGTDAEVAELRQVWQANNLDEMSQQGHLDAIALARSYISVGAGDTPDSAPIVAIESPTQAITRWDPRTRKVKSGWKTWTEDDADATRRGVLYLPNSTNPMILTGDGWVPEQAADAHNMGRCPLVPLVNRPRILRPGGTSEFVDVIRVADAANKMATDMMISGEYHAMPRRWIFGLKEEDFRNKDGSRKSVFSMIKSHIWSSDNKDATAGQFQESALTNFHETIKLLAQITTHLAGLPSDYMAFTSDNPSSADAIVASESRFIKRIERMQTYFGGAWEEAMRIVLFIQTGEFKPEGELLETQWRDPSTPTLASKADAVMKLASGPNPIMPKEMAREELGWSQGKRDLARKYEEDAAKLNARMLSDSFGGEDAA